MANVEVDKKNSFQEHIIYKDADTFEVVRVATEILGMQFKVIIYMYTFPCLCIYAFPFCVCVTYIIHLLIKMYNF